MTPDHPLQFVKAIGRYAAIPVRRYKARGKPPAIVLGFSPWKTFINDWLSEYTVHRRGNKFTKYEFYTSIVPLVLSDPRSKVYVWGVKAPTFVFRFCKRFRIPLIKVEDGFIRSVALGATKAPPLSICMDPKTLYFDATEPSTLEDLLNYHQFDDDLIARARNGIETLLASRLSKYNVGEAVPIEAIYGPKTRKRVLVIGQVEGDMSLARGCAKPMNNNDLVWIAAMENPGAQIIYKPHPEVIHGTRKDPPQSDPRQVEGVAEVLYKDISLADALETVDHVYTLTSLAGFEALLRGIKVTCLGAPFYSGWGLTDDRQNVPRRRRRLKIEELFAAAYILYPKYYNPYKKEMIEFEEALALLSTMKASAQRLQEMKMRARAEKEAAAVLVKAGEKAEARTKTKVDSGKSIATASKSNDDVAGEIARLVLRIIDQSGLSLRSGTAETQKNKDAEKSKAMTSQKDKPKAIGSRKKVA
jgi:capsular polysaccharide export protein